MKRDKEKDLEGLQNFELLLDQVMTPPAGGPYPVWEAARYSLLGQGKRLRPKLLFAACQLFGPPPEQAPVFACALEMVHTYSLIHDDLPAMDNDDFRRGRPSCHKVFGEATAILAGDLLLNGAYELMAESLVSQPDPGPLAAMEVLARAAGGHGMILGQDRDLAQEGLETASLEQIQKTAQWKTAGLIQAALLMGGHLSGAREQVLEALALCGLAAGIAFQIRDDILDCASNRATLGKTPHKDQAAGKKTFVSLAGLEGAGRLLEEKTQEASLAIRNLSQMGCMTESLEELIRLLVERNY